MSPNNTGVTPPPSAAGSAARWHHAKSLSYLEAAKAARLSLSEAYAARDQDRAKIADLHQVIGFALKVSEIHALLAIAPAPVLQVHVDDRTCTGCVGLDHDHTCDLQEAGA